MFNRSGLYLFAIIAAVGVPYFMSAEQAGTRARIAHVWDKMFVDTISDRYPREQNPQAAMSPVPNRGLTPENNSGAGRWSRQHLNQTPWEYRLQEPQPYSAPRASTRGFTSGGIVPSSRWSGQPDVAARSFATTSPSIASLPPVSITPQEMGGGITNGLYAENPLGELASEQGATEWQPVGAATAGIGPTAVVGATTVVGATQGGLTALPIPHAATLPTGVPDEEGWVTVGPGAGFAAGAVAVSPTLAATGTYPGVPAGAEILPGIVVGGPGATSRPNAQQPTQDVEDLLRFEHAPGWVVDSWPRVSTHIIQGDLSGMRVPLVSGTDASALAGSLSYYFDRSQKLQRIAFEGATGDPTRLIQSLRSQHDLQAEPSLGGGMFVAYDPQASNNVGDISSVLRLRRAPVIRADMPLKKYLVMLELNRADSGRKISDEFSRLLQLDQRSQRWLPGNSAAGSPAPNALARPLDPLDPFSPANPNDAFTGGTGTPGPATPVSAPVAPAPALTQNPIAPSPQNPGANVPPQATASPVPLSRGAIPADGHFQNSLLRAGPTVPPPAVAPAAVAPAFQNHLPVQPPPLTNPVQAAPPST